MTSAPSIDFTRVFDLLSYQQVKYPQLIAFASQQAREWKGLSTEQVRQGANSVSAWLITNGLKKGDHVAFIPRMGSPEWIMFDFGCQQIGAVVVPIHPTSSESEMAFILKETEARMCVTADRSLLDKVGAVKSDIPSLVYLFHLEQGIPTEIIGSKGAQSDELLKIMDRVLPSDVLTIMYTSGTSGTPKGAVLTHANVVSAIKAVLSLLPLQPGDRVISFLPFSHIFERASCYGYMAFGVSIYFSHTLDKLREDFLTVRPNFFTCVPRTLEKMYDYLQEQRESKALVKRHVIGWAMKVGAKYQADGTGLLYRMQLMIARVLVLGRWRRNLGGKVKYIGVGAAALRPEIARLFAAAGIVPLSGYGMTEASPFISTNRYLPGLNRLGTVGIPVPGIEVRIDQPNEAGEGEILVRGPNIMSGYFKRPELNAEVFTSDGWFRTGDVGRMVAKRFLAITDRKKDIFKTSTGKYVAPQAVQNHLGTSPFISQSLVIGFNRPYLIGILVPHFQLLKNWCEDQNIHWTSPTYMVHNIKVIAKYQEEIDRLNEGLQSHERIKKFILSDEEWSVENKELTTSFKPIRAKLQDKHKGQIEKLYAGD
ncbi:MAG: long-chain fatty acid--CoA ligase [Cyclobacteriaceae bacterium]|nr:long-chain fatty acid--CoA ligase [Cyclobacteriaceae bacterium]